MSRLGCQTAYLLVGLPLAVAAFVATTTGLALGGGLLITLVGVPVLVATLFPAGGFAWVERSLLIRLVDVAAEPVR